LAPSVRAYHPILGAKLIFLSLFRKAEMKQNSNHIIIISIIWFVLFMVVAQLFTPAEYSLINNTVSELAAQGYENKWIMQIGLIGFGVIFTLGSLLKFYEKRKILWPDIFLMLYAVSILLAGVFSTKPFDGSDVFSRIEDAWHSRFASIAGFSFTLGIVGYIFQTSGKDRFYNFAFLLLVSGISLAFGLSENGIIGEGKGLIQRTLYLVGFVWLIGINKLSIKKNVS